MKKFYYLCPKCGFITTWDIERAEHRIQLGHEMVVEEEAKEEVESDIEL